MNDQDQRRRLEGHLLANGRAKIGFETKDMAKRWLRRSPHPRGSMTIYRCRHCPNFHIGHRRDGYDAAL